MRAFALLLSVLLLFLLALAPILALAQEPSAQPSHSNDAFVIPSNAPFGWLALWDDSRSELITASDEHRDKNRSAPVIQIYSASSGETRFFRLLQHFPRARWANLDAVALGPDGSLLLACAVDSGQPTFIGERLLLLGSDSALLRDFTAFQYDVTAVAMDEGGSVYALGIHDDEASREESYPLIVKYDTFGHIVGEMLPRSLFASEDDPTDDGDALEGNTGTAILWANQDTVRVYLPKVGEMLVLNQDGKIQTRVNVAAKLSEFGLSRQAFAVDGNAFSPAGDLWLAGRAWKRTASDEGQPVPPRDFLVRIKSDGQLDAPNEKVGVEPSPSLLYLIGFTSSNEPVFWRTGPTGNLVLRKFPY